MKYKLILYGKIANILLKMKEGANMKEKIYKKMYLHMFNAVTTVIESFCDEPEKAVLLLKAAQIDCERMYMDAPETRWEQIKRLFRFRYIPRF